jgi:hypothetical protein
MLGLEAPKQERWLNNGMKQVLQAFQTSAMQALLTTAKYIFPRPLHNASGSNRDR